MADVKARNPSICVIARLVRVIQKPCEQEERVQAKIPPNVLVKQNRYAFFVGDAADGFGEQGGDAQLTDIGRI